jgi:hypothetical protein
MADFGNPYVNPLFTFLEGDDPNTRFRETPELRRGAYGPIAPLPPRGEIRGTSPGESRSREATGLRDKWAEEVGRGAGLAWAEQGENLGTMLGQAREALRDAYRGDVNPLLEVTPAMAGVVLARKAGPPLAAPKSIIRPANPGYIRDPLREPMFPSVYDSPKEIIARAAENIAPESDALKRVFPGWSRERLYEVATDPDRIGNVDPTRHLLMAKNPKGSAAAERVMTPENTQRIHDLLEEAAKVPGLRVGMGGWYPLDPVYEYTLKAHEGDPAQANPAFRRLNTVTSMMSPGSDVKTEVARGTALNFLAQQGREQDFLTHGGLADRTKPEHAGKPAMVDLGMPEVPGHAYHSTSQAPNALYFLRQGDIRPTDNPKVVTYIDASGVPQVGFQNRWLVGDSHWSRGVGLDRARVGPTGVAGEMTLPEAQMLWPWYRDITEQHGWPGTSGQAIQWGALGKDTGVKTKIGAPKAEILAERIEQRAKQLGWPIDVTRHMMLRGEMYGLGAAAVPLAGMAIDYGANPPSKPPGFEG